MKYWLAFFLAALVSTAGAFSLVFNNTPPPTAPTFDNVIATNVVLQGVFSGSHSGNLGDEIIAGNWTTPDRVGEPGGDFNLTLGSGLGDEYVTGSVGGSFNVTAGNALSDGLGGSINFNCGDGMYPGSFNIYTPTPYHGSGGLFTWNGSPVLTNTTGLNFSFTNAGLTYCVTNGLIVATNTPSGGGGGGSGGLLSGLTSYIPMSDAANGTRADVVGPNNLTDVNGDLGQVPGLLTYAANFPTAFSSDGLQNNTATLDCTADWSMNFWFQPGGDISADNPYLFEMNDGTSQINCFIWNNNGTLYFQGAAISDHDTSTTLSGGWNQITLVYSATGNTLTLYLNGVSQGPMACTFPSENIISLTIGSQAELSASELGAFCEFGFWTRQLSTGDVTALYNGGAGLPYSSFTN